MNDVLVAWSKDDDYASGNYSRDVNVNFVLAVVVTAAAAATEEAPAAGQHSIW